MSQPTASQIQAAQHQLAEEFVTSARGHAKLLCEAGRLFGEVADEGRRILDDGEPAEVAITLFSQLLLAMDAHHRAGNLLTVAFADIRPSYDRVIFDDGPPAEVEP